MTDDHKHESNLIEIAERKRLKMGEQLTLFRTFKRGKDPSLKIALVPLV